MKRKKTFQYKGLLTILGVFLMMGFVLFAERSGIRINLMEKADAYLSEAQALTADGVFAQIPETALLLTNSKSEDSVNALEQFQQIFLDMKVGYRTVDVSSQDIPDFSGFETVVVLLTDVSPLKESVLKLSEWVEQGGRVLFALTLEKENYLSLIEQKLGIISSGYDNVLVNNIYINENFMLGGGRSYDISDPFDSAWTVELGETAQVYAWTEDERKVPLIWKNNYGQGCFVVDNFGLYVKAVRGLYAASYSLLEDVSVYPVINGSVFYLDDFPSPVPSGDGTYVRRDYGMDIGDFYTNVWWPDMLSLAEKHGVKYTGVIIENYEDDVSETVLSQQDTERFQYFGNMLLHYGGELGCHGYNHQPLSLANTDYGDVLPYKTWESMEAMETALGELIRFGQEMFPQASLSVYVPPSNVLSAEGRVMIAEKFPQIRTIASNYFSSEFAYVQEFGVAEDGVVEQPRIISGAIIDEYMELAAFSELNMHFVNNHFMHPDDLLDEDRGAALGWEKLRSRLEEYMDWLYSVAPALRNLTGSELSGAIQRFVALTVEKEVTDGQIRLTLGNFYDEAWLFVRINEGAVQTIEGGSLERLTGNLYLLKAEENRVTIDYSR